MGVSSRLLEGCQHGGRGRRLITAQVFPWIQRATFPWVSVVCGSLFVPLNLCEYPHSPLPKSMELKNINRQLTYEETFKRLINLETQVKTLKRYHFAPVRDKKNEV